MSIPRQTAEVKADQETPFDIAKKMVDSLIASNLAVNIIMSASIQFLWGMINTLQLIVLVALFKLNFSLRVLMFFEIIA